MKIDWHSLEVFTEKNWAQVPQENKEKALKPLLEFLEKIPRDDKKIVVKWKNQYHKGEKIAEDDPFFHFGVGMQIRNILRTGLRDDELPPVTYDTGEQYRNWDDYYMAALREALGLGCRVKEDLK